MKALGIDFSTAPSSGYSCPPRWAWEFVGPDGGTPAAVGVDFALIAKDGRLREVTGLFGALLLIAAPAASEVLGISPTVLLAVGLLTLGYAAALVGIQSRRLHPGAGWLVIAVNMAWAVASVLLVVAGWLPLTGIGTAVVLIQAVVVAALAELQFMSLRRLV